MIRINKPRTPPRILHQQGKKKAHEHCRQYDAAKCEEKIEHTAFAFSPAIYNHSSVKQALKKAQHGKCSYCESKIEHIDFGDVEHYRPKAAYTQHAHDSLCYPGYYWLAYDWNNLLFSCTLCNRKYKKNCFPLSNPKQRAHSHHNKITREKPLLLNPSATPPELHISFREEIAYPLQESTIGATTIDILQLNREEMVEQRREKKEMIQQLYNTVQTLAHLPTTKEQKQLLREAKTLLKKFVHDSAEYAGMARAYLRSFP